MSAIAAAPPSAAAVRVPVRLPLRYDGDRIQHLSNSSINLFISCPDAWRRRYLLGEKEAPTGVLILGDAVDKALTVYHQDDLAGIQHDIGAITDAYRDAWNARIEEEHGKKGIVWDETLGENEAFLQGIDIVEVAMRELIPRMGRTTHVQRKFVRKIAKDAEWTIVGYPDVETEREQVCWTLESGEILAQDHGDTIPTVAVPWDDAPIGYRIQTYKGELDERLVNRIASLHLLDELTAEQIADRLAVPLKDALPGMNAGPRLTRVKHVIDPPKSKRPDTVPIPVTEFTDRRETVLVPGIADYKVKGKRLTQARADTDLQAGLYLADRALDRNPAADFRFMQVIRDEEHPTFAITRTTRTPVQMRADLLRACAVAAQIDAFYQAFGPDQSWGYAAPDHWRCRLCEYAPACPIGEAR